MFEVYDRVIRAKLVIAAFKGGHGDSVKNPYGNASVASPFAILKDFVEGEDSEHRLIEAVRLPRNNSMYPGSRMGNSGKAGLFY